MRKTWCLGLVVLALGGCGGGAGDAQPFGDVLPDAEVVAEVGSDLAAETGADVAAEAVADSVFDAGDAAPDVGEPTVPFPDQIAQSLSRLLEEYVLYSAEPSASLSVRQGQAAWSGAAGAADLKTGAPVETGMGYRVGSNTKPYIATVILLLAQEGKLTLDDTVGQYFPEHPTWSDVTLRQLLQMRSGIPDYLLSQDMWLELLSEPGKAMTPEALLAFVADLPLEYAPGEQGSYSNTNYLLAGLVIEKVTGHPVEQEVNDRIVIPLKLQGTYLDVGKADENLVSGYMILELAAFALGVDPALLALLPADLFVEQDGVELFDATHFMDPSAAWAAGGIVSTPDDAAVFMHALLSGQMLEDTYLDQMETFVPILLLGSQTDYGLGLIRYQTKWGDAFGHGGLIYGYEAAAMYLPLEDLTLSHMHSTFPTQSWLLSYEAFQVVLEGKELPQTVCQPPAEIREPVLDEPYLSFRFRGLLNKDKDPNVIGGIAAVRGFTGGDPWILSGLGSAGKVTSGMMTRVEVDSLGPAFVPPVRARQTIVSFDTSLLAGASQNPRLAPGPLQKYALVTLVGEIEIDAATQQATRICFVAVNDLTRDWSAYVCDPAAGGPVVGSTLKVWGNVPLTTDPAQVEAYLTPIQIPRCSCNDGSGSWQACE